MAVGDEQEVPEVRDCPSESRNEAGAAELARTGQDKPQDQRDKEEAHSDLRRLGKTPSSKDLPQVDWAFTDEGKLVIQFQDKVLLRQLPQDDPIMNRDLAIAKAPDTQAGAVENVASLEGRPLGKDGQGRVTDFDTPQGKEYKLEYNSAGTVERLSFTGTDGKPHQYQRAADGVSWVDASDQPPSKTLIKNITVGADGTLTIERPSSIERHSPNGTVEKTNLDGSGNQTDKHVWVAGSQVEQTYKPADSKIPTSYEVKDNSGHVTTVEKQSNGHWLVKHGDQQPGDYAKAEVSPTGELKLSSPDGSSLEIKADGSSIRRAGGRVVETTSPDAVTTSFSYDDKGKIWHVEVTDGQGRRVEDLKDKDVKINEKDGSYSVVLDNGNKVERKLDGSQETTDKTGKHIESEADRLLAKFKHFTPEQQQQLKRDLAEIDKLPEAQKKKIYESLERIAKNDEHPEDKIRLTGDQARALVASLAHQIAHPESIQQGYKYTCVSANAEKTLAMNHPEQYASMIEQLVTKGEYTAPGGKHIEVQKNPDGSLAAPSDDSKVRSMTSEIFQSAATQLALPDGQIYRSYLPGHQPIPPGTNPSTDTGERIIGKDGKETTYSGLDAGAKERMLEQLCPNDHYKGRPINSGDDLIKAYEDNGGDKRPPLNVGITLGTEGEFAGMGKQEAGAAGKHAVSITRIDRDHDPPLVYFENTAGGTDHTYPNGKGVPIDDFVKAMKAASMTAVVHDGDAVSDSKKTASNAATEGGTEQREGGAQRRLREADQEFDKTAQEFREAKETEAIHRLGKVLEAKADVHNKLIEGLKTNEAQRQKVYMTVPGSEYRGEGLKTTDLPEFPRLAEKQTIEDLARVHLGPDASEKDVEAYSREIRKINHINNDAELKPGRELLLPGHDENGNLIIQNKDGSSRTITPEGKVMVGNVDGTGYEMVPEKNGGYSVHHHGPKPEDNYDYVRTPDGKGGYTEVHTGKRPEDNYEITRTADEHYFVKDASGKDIEMTEFDAAHPDPRIERAKVLDDADEKITDPVKRAELYRDVQAFEERARKQNLSAEEQARFYHEVDRLLNATDSTNKNLPKEADRIKLAEEIVTHAAYPARIDQGNHGTCGAASLESQMLTKNPSDVARLITDVATTGQFRTADGKIVTPDSSLVKPDREASLDGVIDNKRSYASQIFQDTAVSMERPGYHRVEPVAGGKPEDSGDRFRTGNGSIDKGAPGLYPQEIADINRKIAGNKYDVPVLENADMNEGDGQIHVKDTKELGEKLAELKKEGRLPAIIFVDSRNEPFWTDSGGDKAGGSGGGHFVTITEYDEKKGTVTMVNQWGSESTQKDLPLQELYLGTTKRSLSTIDELQKVVDDNRKKRQVDPVLELELLRQKKADGGFPDDQKYENEVIKVMMETKRHWKENAVRHVDDSGEKKRVNWELYQMMQQLPEDERKKVLDYVNSHGN